MANTHSFQFSGSSQYVSRADSAFIDIDDGWTVEFWMKVEVAEKPSAGTLNSVFHKYDTGAVTGVGAFLDENGILFMYANAVNNAPVTSIDVCDGTWRHFSLNYNGASSKIHINGVLNNGTQTCDAVTTNSTTLYIGRAEAAFLGSNDFKGKIDEIRIWNTNRTAIQILADYQTELVGNESGLQVYWKGNNSLVDSTANAQTLTNNSATFSTDVPFQGEFRLTCETGNYTLTGQDVNFIPHLVMACDTGYYTLTGYDANFISNIPVTKSITNWSALSK